jgi:hypothetical protein
MKFDCYVVSKSKRKSLSTDDHLRLNSKLMVSNIGPIEGIRCGLP